MSALVALTVLFAVELIRAFPALAAFHWSDVHPAVQAGVQVVPFVLAGAILLASSRDPRVPFVAAAFVVVAARLGVQAFDGVWMAGAAALGLAAALVVLGHLAVLGLPLFGGGVLAGVVLDAALHTGLSSRHLVWVISDWSIAVVALIGVWYLWLVAARARRPLLVRGRRVRSTIPLVVIGPVLVLEAFMLANLGWISQVTGLGWVGASLVAAGGAATGLAAAIWTARHPTAPWPLLVVAGAAAMLVLALATWVHSWLWVVAIVAVQATIGSVLTAAGARGADTGGRRAPLAAIGVSYLLALAAITTLDGRGVFGVPLPPTAVLPVTAVLATWAALVAWREREPRRHRPGRADLLSLGAVFGIPAALLVGTVPALVQPALVTVDSAGLRVVTYNVGLAFDLDGRLNLDGVARTLERVGPDVVSLQEVPRGHLPTGGVDMVGWLQRRLDLPYVAFQPSSPNAMHGNAILSRYPIREIGQAEFPRVGTSLPRGALAVEVELDGFEPVVVIGAHLPPGGTLGVRAERVEAILELWARRPRTIIAADLNSQPGSDILRRFDDAAWVSAWDPDDGPGHTFPADRPEARIDWVLTTPDLAVLDAEVVPSRASDHRPLLAVIELG